MAIVVVVLFLIIVTYVRKTNSAMGSGAGESGCAIIGLLIMAALVAAILTMFGWLFLALIPILLPIAGILILLWLLREATATPAPVMATCGPPLTHQQVVNAAQPEVVVCAPARKLIALHDYLSDVPMHGIRLSVSCLGTTYTVMAEPYMYVYKEKGAFGFKELVPDQNTLVFLSSYDLDCTLDTLESGIREVAADANLQQPNIASPQAVEDFITLVKSAI